MKLEYIIINNKSKSNLDFNNLAEINDKIFVKKQEPE